MTSNVTHNEICTSLDEVLLSPVFRTSKQCQQLLRYIVENTVEDNDELLRERIIGNAVFGRSLDYDTGNDPVVRARVAEVRKRLARYYLEQGEADGVYISIPKGAYKATFSPARKNSIFPEFDAHAERDYLLDSSFSLHVSDPDNMLPAENIDAELTESDAPLSVKPRPRWRRILSAPFAALTLLVVALIVVLAFIYGQIGDRSNQFWEPFLHGKTIPLLYADSRDVIPTARIVTVLAQHGRDYDIRYGNDVSITDMRARPVILIGAFGNQYTVQFLSSLRYSVVRNALTATPSGVNDFDYFVVDQFDRKKTWHKDANNDYSIIVRHKGAQIGGPVLILAGLGNCGTQSAGNFIANKKALDMVLRNAPVQWKQMNMEIVLHTATLNNVPISTDVVAMYFW